jgi:membrane protein YqaA with SNARE-associated domain
MFLETDLIIAFAGVAFAAALGGVVHWYFGKKEEEARRNAKKDG